MQKGKKSILRQEVEIDHTTGEVCRSKQTIQFAPEPNYIKLYLDCLGVFSGNVGLSVSLNEIFIEVLKLVSYADDDQLVTINGYIKKRISEKTGKSIRRIDQALQLWVETNVLIRVARGTYQLNPYLFGRGDWRDIESLRANLDFRKGTFETERIYHKVKAKTKTKEEEVQVNY